jgi:hypothetical protein
MIRGDNRHTGLPFQRPGRSEESRPMSVTPSVSADELFRHLRSVASEVRLSGSPEEARAFDYIQAELDRFGYVTRRYAFKALVGYPQRAELEVLGAVSTAIPANGYSMSPATLEGGVTGDVVHVGKGLAEDYRGIDLRGKIALSDGLAMPGKARLSSAVGAIGHIHINDDHIHEMCISQVWGTPTPETAALLPNVPAVGVTRADGARLKELLAQGPLTVRLETHPYLAWTAIPALTADLPGTADDTFVLFSGHVDSWHLGVMDNGTANATQLEVARILAEHAGNLRRGVRLAFWSGHSHARYAGSAWYADHHWHDLHERCVCHVNIDSVGAIGATILEEAPSMAETHPFGDRVMRQVTGVGLDYRRISRSSDQSFWGHGIPTLFGTFSEQERDDSEASAAMADLLGAGGRGGGLGWWWHTTEDTIDKIDAENLVRDATVYVETLWQLCTLERLPFDYAATADEFGNALARYDDDSLGRLDLTRARELADRLARHLRSGIVERMDATRANALAMELGRILIPVNYTRTGPFEHDLALATVPLPGLAEAGHLAATQPDSPAHRYLLTRLERERNRIEHALRAALRAAGGEVPDPRH